MDWHRSTALLILAFAADCCYSTMLNTNAEIEEVLTLAYDKFPGDNCCAVREDYTELCSICRNIVPRHVGGLQRRALQVFMGVHLHALYYPKAVAACAAKMKPALAQLKRNFGNKNMLRALRKIVRMGLNEARECKGPKSFPYQVPGGDKFWKSLMPHTAKLWLFARKVVRLKEPRWRKIEDIFRASCGLYSYDRNSKCKYMRRHTTRWVQLYLKPTCALLQADWDLAVCGMGSGAAKGILLVRSELLDDALHLCSTLGRLHRSIYGLHDLTVFLCLCANFIESKLRKLRIMRAQKKKKKRKAEKSTGTRMRLRGHWTSEVWDGTKVVYI